MAFVDLGPVAAPDAGVETDAAPPSWEGERTGVTLPELLHLGARSGVVLPISPGPDPDARLDRRLGGGVGDGASALEELLAAFPDPVTTLRQRGLLAPPETDPDAPAEDAPGKDAPAAKGGDGLVLAPWLAGSLRVLGEAEVSVDLDLAFEGARVRSWHHAASDLLATVSTADGSVFELTLLPLRTWHRELERAATPPVVDTGTPGRLGHPSPHGTRLPELPDGLQVPLELLNAGCDALEQGRDDVLAELLHRHAGRSRLAGGARADDDLVALCLRRLARPAGRLRALVTARPTTPRAPAAGVLSWVLLDDGWRQLQPVGTADDPQVRLDRRAPTDLGTALSPLLAEVVR